MYFNTEFLVCSTNQLTGFYMIETSAFNELKKKLLLQLLISKLFKDNLGLAMVVTARLTQFSIFKTCKFFPFPSSQ